MDWPCYGLNRSEDRFSLLRQIDERTVPKLGLAWYLDLPNQGTLEATPIEIGGFMYFTGSNAKTFAVDAVTGREIWEFDPHTESYNPAAFRFSASLGGNRGVAYWNDRIYVAATDGRLFALNATSGDVLWSKQTLDNSKSERTISGAPRVFRGLVIIGNSCSHAKAGGRGYVTAYDALTGDFHWRFYTVPGDPSRPFENAAMAAAAKTWHGAWWKQGGNGSVWDTIVCDDDLGRIYIGTADRDERTERSDDAGLFTSSVVALDAATGRYLWHYQENPGGDYDYDSAASMILTEMTVRGVRHKVLLHAPKNGLFYVIDRVDGRLLTVEPFTKVTWASDVDTASGRPIENASTAELWPSFIGAHDWQPMSSNPTLGLVYIPAIRLGYSVAGHRLVTGTPGEVGGELLAWDPAAQRLRWKVALPSVWNGGTLATAGNLVFQGNGRGEFAAYDARTGKKLWSYDAGLGIVASPISYAVGGTQYISILVGYGGAAGALGKLADCGWRFGEQPRRLLTFGLGAGRALPKNQPPRFNVNAADDPALIIDARMASRGAQLYGSNCARCHGFGLRNNGSYSPDLRESRLATNLNAFSAVVLHGLLAAGGMPRFDNLTSTDTAAIYMYVRQGARESDVHSRAGR